MKRILFSLLTLPPVNAIVRRLIKIAIYFFDSPMLLRVPAAGKLGVELPGCRRFRMISDGTDVIASCSYYRGGLGFEPETTSVFYGLVQPDSVILDIGSNTGNFSLMAAAKYPSVKIRAFEPLPRVFKWLRANIEENQFINIVHEELALSDSDGEASFYVSPSLTLPKGSSLNKQATVVGEEEMITVKTMTLDHYVESSSLNRVDIIKVDTETTEPEVLKGGEMTISRFRPAIVCEVLNTGAASQLESFFADKSYEYWSLLPKGPVKHERIEVNPNIELRNYLFVPGEQSDRVFDQLRGVT